MRRTFGTIRYVFVALDEEGEAGLIRIDGLTVLMQAAAGFRLEADSNVLLPEPGAPSMTSAGGTRSLHDLPDSTRIVPPGLSGVYEQFHKILASDFGQRIRQLVQ
ncbi:MAG: hypothetical protein L0Y43_00530 [Methylococcaceae bacterium]|nr:hypothetical protein [Methylococcaceae bacterium]